MDIYFASSNQGKIQEVQHFFSLYHRLKSRFILKTLHDMPSSLQKMYQPQEDGTSFSENAFIKAKALHNLQPAFIFAEDSGLEVKALGGQPGILSARYAEDDGKKIARLLQELKSQTNREACFVTSLCFLSSRLMPIYFFGRVDGDIASAPRGENGFGYDPVFVPRNQANDETKTFAELSLAQKRALSHRGKALENFFCYLQRWQTFRNGSENVDI